MYVELMFHETLRVYYERKELIRKVSFDDFILPLKVKIYLLLSFLLDNLYVYDSVND